MCLLPKASPYPNELIDEYHYLMCPCIHRVISQEDCAEHTPCLDFFCGRLTACDRIHSLLFHKEVFVHEWHESPPSKYSIPTTQWLQV